LPDEVYLTDRARFRDVAWKANRDARRTLLDVSLESLFSRTVFLRQRASLLELLSLVTVLILCFFRAINPVVVVFCEVIRTRA
jgi:hypothetical protein